jgi:hypothetical protein
MRMQLTKGLCLDINKIETFDWSNWWRDHLTRPPKGNVIGNIFKESARIRYEMPSILFRLWTSSYLLEAHFLECHKNHGCITKTIPPCNCGKAWCPFSKYFPKYTDGRTVYAILSDLSSDERLPGQHPKMAPPIWRPKTLCVKTYSISELVRLNEKWSAPPHHQLYLIATPKFLFYVISSKIQVICFLENCLNVICRSKSMCDSHANMLSVGFVQRPLVIVPSLDRKPTFGKYTTV